MRVEVQVRPEAALDLRKPPVGSAAAGLVAELEQLGLKLEAMHPGQTHPLLAPYFKIEVPDRRTAELVIGRLTKNRLVEAAYLRPEDAAP